MCLLCFCNVMISLSVKNQHLDYSTDLVQMSAVDWKSSFAFNYVNMNLFGSGFISIWSLMNYFLALPFQTAMISIYLTSLMDWRIYT